MYVSDQTTLKKLLNYIDFIVKLHVHFSLAVFSIIVFPQHCFHSL